VDLWKKIHQLSRETARFEPIVYPATVRPAEVGMLLSLSEDVHERELGLRHEAECLYLALRHSGHVVDLIGEEEVQNGKLGGIKVLFFVGNHLETATARALRKWVEEGGVLSGSGGGGFLDEFNKPMNILADVYGIEEQKIKRGDLNFGRQPLAKLKPLDTVHWQTPERKLPALGLKQTLKPVKEARVLARYADGSPACIVNRCDKGHAILNGTLLATAYVHAALGEQADKPFLPEDFDFDVGDIATAATGQGEARFDALLDHPLVEVNLLESTEGIAVTLVNWTPEPKSLKLTLQGVSPVFNQATSLRKGPLDMVRIVQTITIPIQVDVADMILLEK
jgi:hypothetical protein